MPTNDELMIAMARRIAAASVERLDGYSQGAANYAADILEGKCDDEAFVVQAALSAIRETRELCAKMAYSFEDATDNRVEAMIFARMGHAIRSGQHLEQPDAD